VCGAITVLLLLFFLLAAGEAPEGRIIVLAVGRL
jgi:hypothetical protein